MARETENLKLSLYDSIEDKDVKVKDVINNVLGYTNSNTTKIDAKFKSVDDNVQEFHDYIFDSNGDVIFYSKAEVEAKIKESLAAQREEDYARVRYWASNDPTSPASFIGGTWERIEGEFIMGASSAYPVGTTGGSATHTQTVAEMPSHNHSGSTGGAGGHSHTFSAAVTQKYEVSKIAIAGADGSGTYGYTFSSGTATTSWVGDHTHGVSIGRSGSGQAMSVLNPYYALYIWVRVDDAA